MERVRVNSIHHQAIKDLSPKFEAEAFSVTDGIVEAIRRDDRCKSYIAAWQWHPKFHIAGSDSVDEGTIFGDFLAAVTAAKAR